AGERRTTPESKMSLGTRVQDGSQVDHGRSATIATAKAIRPAVAWNGSMPEGADQRPAQLVARRVATPPATTAAETVPADFPLMRSTTSARRIDHTESVDTNADSGNATTRPPRLAAARAAASPASRIQRVAAAAVAAPE